jgi:hypothetical protein
VILPPEQIDMAIETLEFCEEICIRKVAVNYADRIVDIQRRHQRVPCIPNSLHVSGRDVASRPDQYELFVRQNLNPCCSGPA